LAFKALLERREIVLLGKANQARYVMADSRSVTDAVASHTTFKRIFTNSSLEEELVFRTVQRETAILFGIPKNTFDIVYYAFTEMLNNAIEHSHSQTIEITMKRLPDRIEFSVADKGVGIFNNIRQRLRLQNDLEAIQELLKGKQTTDPARHSGEGIFFTSRVADRFTIKSGGRQVVFDNSLPDVFIVKSRVLTGTKVEFALSRDTVKTTNEIFSKYIDTSFAFNSTHIRVDLHKGGTKYISRSQARRIVNSLDPFKEIVLDFKDVETVGQGFADEIFRVWQGNHKDVRIVVENANENVMFMIRHAQNT
jgi:anti-sigma regulatory factor (Ser/Thr protein kinase)/uncharacterized protein (DUF1330 family)